MTAILMDRNELLACVARLSARLQSHGVDLPSPSTGASSGAGLVEKLPSGIARYGSVIEGKNVWVYLEPHTKIDPGLPRQILICLPSGRYLVDTFDTVLRACIARESAAGNPLVVGIVDNQRPILLWIRSMGRFEEI